MAIALHHSRATGTARLVLIGIANHDGDGGSWPAIDTLSIYAGGVDRRNVQRALEQLEQLHEVQRVVQAGGTAGMAERRRPNLYLFLLTCPPNCDRSKHHRTGRSRPTPLPVGDSTGAAAAPPRLSTGAAAAPPLGAAVAPPEQNHEEITKEPRPATDRARQVCTDGSTTHAVSRKSRRCVYCGASGADL